MSSFFGLGSKESKGEEKGKKDSTQTMKDFVKVRRRIIHDNVCPAILEEGGRGR
jgi:hypothetical protein